ncbi:hypothetical protein [Streptomyces sp. NPDC127098]|uniref:hypothetical protein n=1 Tax=Streptomyces sp. NPDC127098 TaxID=3347137 RepID=UPI0036697FEA
MTPATVMLDTSVTRRARAKNTRASIRPVHHLDFDRILIRAAWDRGGGARTARTRRTPVRSRMPAAPVEVLRHGGLVPTARYPGHPHRLWPARCVDCLLPQEVSVHLVAGGYRCGHSRPLGQQGLAEVALRRDTRHLRAMNRLLAARYEPVVPYPGSQQGWPAVCINCGELRFPQPSNHRRIKPCNHVLTPVTSAEAVMELAAADLVPLEPYPGHIHDSWWAHCRQCHLPLHLTLTRVRAGWRCGHSRVHTWRVPAALFPSELKGAVPRLDHDCS